MASQKQRKFATAAVQGGRLPDDGTGSHVTPIYPTSTFLLGSLDRGERLFSGEEAGFIYTRLTNPTVSALETQMAELEGAEASVAFASGMGAITSVIFSLLRSGDEIVFLGPLYGGTRGMFEDVLPRFGITTRAATVDTLEEALTDRTKLIYGETPTNPTLRLHDFTKVAEIAQQHGVLTAFDNTFASPALSQPIRHGIDLVLHSATKYLGGHGDLIAGIVSGSEELLTEIRMEGLRHFGAVIDPHTAWLVLRGIKTLHVRMQRHSENAAKVAEALDGHPALSHVHYPGLPHHPEHELAKKQLAAFGGMVSIEFAGGREAAAKFLEATEIFDNAVSLGDVSSLASHPASTTHQLLTTELLEREHITPSLVRLSVGIEDVDDLIADLRGALDAVIS